MTREIKFRAWDKKEGKMREGVEFAIDGMGEPFVFITNGEETCNYFQLMQFTGLRDINRKEIYEGDVVTMNPIGSTGIRTGSVIWMNDGWFVSDETERDNEKRLWEDSFGMVKVVGNIYESPDLLTPNETK